MVGQRVDIKVGEAKPTSSITGIQNIYKRYKAPPANHPNGMCCPNCESWTWRTTQYCVECPYDIWLHFEKLEKKNKKQVLKKRSLYCLLFAAICFAVGYISLNYFSTTFGAIIIVFSILAFKLGVELEQGV